VCNTCTKKVGEDLINQVIIFKQQIMLNIWLDDKVVGHTKVSKTQRMTGLLSAVLQVMSYSL